ncbi:hypothetical protein AQUCO_10000017v1 [Aquilegia coerulea]|uniref:Uncharacterized protein n=1 Tax=Aquilegia coerulea TaxID=218851 RepID=A0A2G5C462_AQUCA|nr:hypothetical protein AQUCO_10000017v1 [Aquilegia coerulea]
MTMVPAKYLSKSKQQNDSYNGCEDSYSSSCLLASDDDHHHHHHLQPIIMPEEESCCLNSNKEDDDDEDEGEGDDNEPWLQLGLGGQESAFNPINLQTQRRCNDLVELDLLPSSSSSSQPISLAFNPTNNHVITSTISNNSNLHQPLLLQHQHQHQQEVSWGYRPYLWQPTFTSLPSSSSSLSAQPHPSMNMYYLSPPFQYPGYNTISPSSSSSGIRVIDAPRKLRSSVWFMIQASQNQAKEPFLPQISRRYLRIKDGKMTVHVLMKYLVRKLRLNNESEVEITCRGQQLPHFLTLQDVRDNIWRLRNAVFSFADDSTTDYIMLLHYGRRSED